MRAERESARAGERGVNNSAAHYAVILFTRRIKVRGWMCMRERHNNIYCLTFRELQNNRNVGASD